MPDPASPTGYTEAQFAQQIKAKYPEYKDWADHDLTTSMIQKYPEYKSWLTLGTKPEHAGRTRDWIDKTLDWLPAAGGTAGAIAGEGLMSVPLAMGGAAAGETVRQGVEKIRGPIQGQSPQTAGGRIYDVGKEAVTSGLLPEVGGKAIGALARAPAKLVTRGALGRVPMKILESFDTSTREIVTTLLDQGLAVTEEDLTRIGQRIGNASTALKAQLKAVGKTVNPDGVGTALATVRRDFLKEEDQAAIDAVEHGFRKHRVYGKTRVVGQQTQPTGVLDQFGKPITKQVPVTGKVTPNLPLDVAHAWKQRLYHRLGSAHYLSAGTSTERAAAAGEEGVARYLKTEIETEAKKAGLDVKAANATMQKLMAAQAAMRAAIHAPMPTPGMVDLVTRTPLLFLARVVEQSPAARFFLQRGLYDQAARITKVSPILIRVAEQAISERDGGQDQLQPAASHNRTAVPETRGLP